MKTINFEREGISLNNMTASNEWTKRPIDERFWTIDDLRAAARDAQYGAEQVFYNGPVRVEGTTDGGIRVRVSSYTRVPTNYAFDQLCARASVPAGLLRSLSAETAGRVLDEKLRDRSEPVSVLLAGEKLRAVNGPKYPRVWNADIVDSVLTPLADAGWIVPPGLATTREPGKFRPATPADCSPVSKIQPGDIIGPSGLYMGDRDFFGIMAKPGTGIDDGSDGGLHRAVIVRNSEVGAGYLEVIAFMLRVICGNHILWDCQEIGRVKYVHSGRKIFQAAAQLRDATAIWAGRSALEDENRIARARMMPVIPDLRTVPELARRGVTAKTLGDQGYGPQSLFLEAWDVAENAGDAPDTRWGMVQGVTALAQRGTGQSWAGDRLQTDRIAQRLLATV